jgi:hypothetical protein
MRAFISANSDQSGPPFGVIENKGAWISSTGDHIADVPTNLFVRIWIIVCTGVKDGIWYMAESRLSERAKKKAGSPLPFQFDSDLNIIWV